MIVQLWIAQTFVSPQEQLPFDQFVRFQAFLSTASNTKIIWGEVLPYLYLD